MAQLVCGRCGRRTAPNSTYCPHDKWVLYAVLPESDQRIGAAIDDLEIQRGMGGILARRRMERDFSHLERTVHDAIERRVTALEKRTENDSQDWEAQRALGVLALIERHWSRAHAHLELAHRLNPADYEVTINYAIALAQRGQIQPALELLQKAQQTWPRTPALLLNLAMVALEARRPMLVLETIKELEGLWQENAALAQDFHDEAQTLRGLAYLQQHKYAPARHYLQLAAGHTVVPAQSARYNLDGDDQLGAEKRSGQERRTSSIPDLPAAVAADRRQGERRASEVAIASTLADDDEVEYSSDQLLDDDNGHSENGNGKVLAGKTADADLLNNLGMAEAAAGENDRAIKRFAAAMRLEPGNARIHNNLGVLAYAQGQLQTALKHLEIARDIEDHIEKPEPSTFNHLGVVLSAMGRNEESLEEFQKAGAHERAEFEVWYNLGRAYIEHGKPERGVEFLRRAFQAEPNDADVHTVLGSAYLLRGQMQLLPEAMKHLKRALQINPRHRTALTDIAIALMEMGQNEQALRVVQEELKTYPRSAEAMFLMALVSLRIADDAVRAQTSNPALKDRVHDDQALARASQLFNRAFDLRPDLLVTLYNMALCQYVIGFRDSAARQLEHVVARDPSIAPAYYLMGVGHADAKRWKEALEAWQTAARYEPGNPDLEANMGYIYYQRGDWAQAISHYVKAHRAAPDQADLLSALGLCYARDKQLNKAIQAFEHSLRLAPHAPVTHSNLGLAYYFQTQVERALDQWRIVSQLDAAYASRREEDQYTNFDDSLVGLRPLNWRSRIIRMAPVLPPSHTQMVPGYNARAYRLAVSDPAIKELDDQARELDVQSREIGFAHAHK